jgi:Domain of unknown function (DUF4386)
MTISIAEIPQRRIAILSGLALVAMALFAGVAYGVVLNSLFVPENAVVTMANIKASMLLFRAGIFSWLMVLLLDVVVAWGLYVFLKPVSESLSLLAALLRLVYTAFLATAILNLVVVVLLLSDAEYIKVLEIERVQALVMLFLNAFMLMWSIGLVVFGFYLLVLGYVVFTSENTPKIFGVLLFIASLSYLIIHCSGLLLPQYKSSIATLNSVLSAPMAIGELSYAVWLIVKGGKIS